jgi:hypothetical protein
VELLSRRRGTEHIPQPASGRQAGRLRWVNSLNGPARVPRRDYLRRSGPIARGCLMEPDGWRRGRSTAPAERGSAGHDVEAVEREVHGSRDEDIFDKGTFAGDEPDTVHTPGIARQGWGSREDSHHFSVVLVADDGTRTHTDRRADSSTTSVPIAWSGPVRSSSSSRARSWFESVKSKNWAFSAMRSRCVYFGRTGMPRSMLQ